jgi:hypothetical protein
MGWFEDNGLRRRGPNQPGGPREDGGGVRQPGDPDAGGPQPGPVFTPPQTPLPQNTAALNGWDQTKWDDPNHNTIKYQVGRILQKYPKTVEGLKQAQAELTAAFPSLTFNGKDTITIPGEGSWDVLKNASGGGEDWQWITKTNPDGTPYVDTGGNPGNPGNLGNLGNPGNPGNPGMPSVNGGVGGSVSGGTPSIAVTPPMANGAPQFTNISPFQAPTVPGAAPTYTPTAFTAPAAVTPTAITAQGAAPSYSAGTINPVTGAPSYQAGTLAPVASAPSYSAGNVSAQGAYQPYQAPSAFSYGQPVPSTYTGTAPLNAAKAAPTYGDPGKFSYDPLKSSDAFKLPTGQEALAQDPGYQFRLEQGLGAIQAAAVAKGLGRDGGTYKALIDYGQKAGSQEYQNAVNRSLGTYTTNQGVRQAEQGQQYGQSLSAQQQNATQNLNKFNAELAGQGQQFQQAATQQGMNEAQNLAGYNANLTGQNQGFTQAAGTAQMNATNNLNAYNANASNFNLGADRDLTAQQQNQTNAFNAAGLNSQNTNTSNALNAQIGQQNQTNAFNAAGLNSQNLNTTNALNTQIGQSNQTNAFNAAGLNSANYNTAAGNNLTAQQNTQANNLAAAGLNAQTGLAANAQNNAATLGAAQFNAGQTQQGYTNAFNAANTAYGYQNQQNLASNAQNLAGYQTSVNQNLSQQQIDQGWKQLDITAEQQAFSRSLSAQQQQWMQAYMERGQTWDEAYRQMMARLQYA